tara:strand:+ start:1849 stop:2124 length:276 start_codon:yes stop_codon:yes gene_type:complete
MTKQKYVKSQINLNNMSKMKELDEIATNVADVMRELLDKNTEWAADGTIVDGLSGDDYYEAINYIKMLAINKLYWGDKSPLVDELQNKHES